MKIATFNINSIRGRLARLIEWLDEAQPDVVCLQELRIHHAEFPVDAIRAAGYTALWQGQQPRYHRRQFRGQIPFQGRIHRLEQPAPAREGAGDTESRRVLACDGFKHPGAMGRGGGAP